MARRYAEGTDVPPERSQAEVQRLLVKHGADQVATYNNVKSGQIAVAFEMGGTRVRFEMAVPTFERIIKELEDPPRGWGGWTPAQRRQWAEKQAEQMERSRWRALVLVTKAKLELVAEGVSTVEREFMADIVLPNGQRVEQWLTPQLPAATGGKMPPLLKR